MTNLFKLHVPHNTFPKLKDCLVAGPDPLGTLILSQLLLQIQVGEDSARPPGAILLLPQCVEDLLLLQGVLMCVFSLGGLPKKEKSLSL